MLRRRRVLEPLVLSWLFALLPACAASEPDGDGGAREEAGEHAALDNDAGATLDASARADAGLLDAARAADSGQRDVSSPPLNALPACSGHMHPPVGRACRTLSDCGGGSFACGPGEIAACGVCSITNATSCTSDTQCGAGFVCEPTRAASSGVPFAGCVNACNVSSCSAGMRCAASGHCQLLPCGEGGACSADHICDASRSGADTRGCAPKSCETDGYACPPKYRCGGTTRDAYGCSPRPCTEDYVCPAGSECGGSAPDAHGCSLTHCTQGYACPQNTDCKAGQMLDHGCTRRTCNVDADCDCGACLSRVCEDQLHICSLGAP
jgi:hypothetical protein